MHDANARCWRAAALLLGASWIVMLGVACGGGGDEAAAQAPPDAAAARWAAVGTGAGSRAAAPESLARPAPGADATRVALMQPCLDPPRQAGPPGPPAVVPASVRAPASPEAELSDEALALTLAPGKPGAAAGTAQGADPFGTQ